MLIGTPDQSVAALGVPDSQHEPPKESSDSLSRRPGRWMHLVAVLWTFVLAGATLAPALARGWMLGTYDLLGYQGLTSRSGVVLHGSYANSDIMNEMVQWTALNWTEVHHGVLPLWNPYNGQGLPLAFNWQAASFGIPSLVGYLFPLRFAYTAGVVATLVIAGTGAYFFARVLRMGFLGSIMVATVFELSGPLMGWLGYPHGQVMAWGGWLFAAGVLVVRGTRPVASIALLAAVIACSLYSGQPETFVLMLGALAVFVVVLLGVRALAPQLDFEPGPIRRPATNLAIAIAAGVALGAPLLLPGVQLTNASVRSVPTSSSALSPLHDLFYLIFSSFDGVPVPGNIAFGRSYYYNEFAAYVGLIALVLGAVAVVTGFRRHRPEVLATFAVVVAAGVVAFFAPLEAVLYRIPVIREIDLLRALMPLSLGLATLAGFGLDEVVRRPRARAVRLTLLNGFAGSAVLLLAIWLFGRGGAYKGLPRVALGFASHVRAESFVWPTVSVAVGLAAAALVWWRPRLRMVAAGCLLVCESLFLIAAGSIQVASSPNGFPPTPAVAKLQHAVGSSTVATGRNDYCSIGVTADANIGYQLHEVYAYDPIVPKSDFTAWRRETGTSAGLELLNEYCPAVTTVGEARLLGAAYVLEAAGAPGPQGASFVTELKVPRTKSLQATYQGIPLPPVADVNEDLYRVPGAAQATLIRIASLDAALPRIDAPGVPVRVDDSNPGRWSLTTDASTPTVLRLHLSDVPGWHASMDGRPLGLESLAGFMLQARIPPGHHQIQLSYWPATFTVGLVLALVTAIALAIALGVEAVRRARSRRTET
jgi:hypothetical protein